MAEPKGKGRSEFGIFRNVFWFCLCKKLFLCGTRSLPQQCNRVILVGLLKPGPFSTVGTEHSWYPAYLALVGKGMQPKSGQWKSLRDFTFRVGGESALLFALWRWGQMLTGGHCLIICLPCGKSPPAQKRIGREQWKSIVERPNKFIRDLGSVILKPAITRNYQLQ